MEHALDYALLAGAAFLASLISGLGGFGGAFVLVIALTPVVGAKAVVPIVSVFAVFSNISRLYIYRATVNGRLATQFTLASLPGVAIGANILAVIPERAFLVLMGTVLLTALPARRYLDRTEFKPGLKSIIGLGFVFGIVSGTAAGSGMFVIAGLSAVGLQGTLLLGTDAGIGLVNALARTWSYWLLDLLDTKLIAMGVILGLVTFPGSWVASLIVHRLGLKLHTRLIEILIVTGGIWFIYLALGN